MNDDDHDQAMAMYRAATDLAAASDLDGARALYEAALEIWRADSARQVDVARTLHNLALLHDQAGDPEAAAQLWAQGRAVANDLRSTGAGE